MINLLPWRTNQRQKIGRFCLLIMLINLILVTFLLLVWNHNLKANLDIKRKDNLNLKHKIDFLSAQILIYNNPDKSSVSAKDVQKLMHEKIQTTTLFKDLCDALPRGAYLQKISLRDSDLSIIGFVHSFEMIKKYVLNLDQVSSVRKPIFYELEKQSDGSVRFNMKTKLSERLYPAALLQ